MEKILEEYLKKTWFKESFFYILLFSMFNLGEFGYIFSSKYTFLSHTIQFTILYIHAMLHRFWLLPYFFDKKQKRKYLQIAIVLLLVFSTVTNFSQKMILKFEPKFLYQELGKYKQIHDSNNVIDFWSDVSLNMLCVIFFSSIYFVMRNIEQEKQQAKNQSLINQLEINQLREQLNPHFMFNTLNNLYGVSLEQPQRTPDLILKLSQMMRYQIEASRKEYVSLNEEIDFIESYIAIENERVSNRCKVQFEKKLFENELKITPILLLPFIENAFKHGTYSTEKSFIDINISLLQNSAFKEDSSDNLFQKGIHTFLLLKIENSIPQKTKNIQSTGIGLENVQQRLLRLYDHKHVLTISPSATTFNIQLKLILNS